MMRFVLAFLFVWPCLQQKSFSGENLNAPGSKGQGSYKIDVVGLDAGNAFIYKYPNFSTVNPYQFFTVTLDSRVNFEDVASNRTVQIAPICEGNEIKYNFNLALKYQRDVLQVADFTRSGDFIYFVNIGGAASTFEVYQLFENQNKSLNIMQTKKMDINTPPEKIFQISDLNVLIIDERFVLVRIEGKVLVFSLPIAGNPIYKGDFTVANIDDPTLKKTLSFNRCIYLLDADSVIKVFCLNEALNDFVSTYNFTQENLAKAIPEKDRPKNLEGSVIKVEDFWVEDNLLMILDKTFGVFIYNIEDFSKGNLSSAALPVEVFYQHVVGGTLIKKANRTLQIVYEYRSTMDSSKIDSYLIEYFIIGNGSPGSPIALRENRREYFQLSTIRMIHRTKDFIITEEANLVRILRHSLPKISGVQPLKYSNIILENLMNIHQASSAVYDNLVLVAFPEELHFYTISSSPLSLLCQPTQSGKSFTVATQFYSPTCPEKVAARNTDPDSFCVNNFLTQFTVGVVSVETDKTVGVAVGVSLGLLCVLIVGCVLLRKYKFMKNKYEQLQQEAVHTKEQNPKSESKKDKHFDIDDWGNQKGYSISDKV